MEFLPFHADELEAQRLAGHVARGRAPIRPFMPDQHRSFFEALPFVLAATLGAGGWPTATVLTGRPGFIASPDTTTLRIAARPADDDPANFGLASGAPIGLLGLEFQTRRRNRANGTIAGVDTTGFSVTVQQSFGNCPQYIHDRLPSPRPRGGAPAESLAGLDAAARSTIARADTFFVASRSRPELGADGGLDISHRGGPAGFVAIEGNELAIPDFRGNKYFNTLGNLLGDPRAGLLFVDFATGDLLQLQGRTAIDWQPERRWRLSVERAWRRRAAFPFAWSVAAG